MSEKEMLEFSSNVGTGVVGGDSERLGKPIYSCIHDNEEKITSENKKKIHILSFRPVMVL